MLSTLRTLVAGTDRPRRAVALDLVGVALVFVVTFGAYALGVFAVSGGVVFVPGHAVLVGVVVAAFFAVRERGLLLAVLAVYAALLGSSADHYLLGLSGRSLAERLAAFLQPDGLVYLAVLALVVGTVTWVLGTLTVVAMRTAGVGPIGHDG